MVLAASSPLVRQEREILVRARDSKETLPSEACFDLSVAEIRLLVA